jgi:hypothetical protein
VWVSRRYATLHRGALTLRESSVERSSWMSWALSARTGGACGGSGGAQGYSGGRSGGGEGHGGNGGGWVSHVRFRRDRL